MYKKAFQMIGLMFSVPLMVLSILYVLDAMDYLIKSIRYAYEMFKSTE